MLSHLHSALYKIVSKFPFTNPNQAKPTITGAFLPSRPLVDIDPDPVQEAWRILECKKDPRLLSALHVISNAGKNGFIKGGHERLLVLKDSGVPHDLIANAILAIGLENASREFGKALVAVSHDTKLRDGKLFSKITSAFTSAAVSPVVLEELCDAFLKQNSKRRTVIDRFIYDYALDKLNPYVFIPVFAKAFSHHPVAEIETGHAEFFYAMNIHQCSRQFCQILWQSLGTKGWQRFRALNEHDYAADFLEKSVATLGPKTLAKFFAVDANVEERSQVEFGIQCALEAYLQLTTLTKKLPEPKDISSIQLPGYYLSGFEIEPFQQDNSSGPFKNKGRELISPPVSHLGFYRDYIWQLSRQMELAEAVLPDQFNFSFHLSTSVNEKTGLSCKQHESDLTKLMTLIGLSTNNPARNLYCLEKEALFKIKSDADRVDNSQLVKVEQYPDMQYRLECKLCSLGMLKDKDSYRLEFAIPEFMHLVANAVPSEPGLIKELVHRAIENYGPAGYVLNDPQIFNEGEKYKHRLQEEFLAWAERSERSDLYRERMAEVRERNRQLVAEVIRRLRPVHWNALD